jgi:hypothetical protein
MPAELADVPTVVIDLDPQASAKTWPDIRARKDAPFVIAVSPALSLSSEMRIGAVGAGGAGDAAAGAGAAAVGEPGVCAPELVTSNAHARRVSRCDLRMSNGLSQIFVMVFRAPLGLRASFVPQGPNGSRTSALCRNTAIRLALDASIWGASPAAASIWGDGRSSLTSHVARGCEVPGSA